MEHAFIDLHIHSTASDGTTAPEDLLDTAAKSVEDGLVTGDLKEFPKRMILALTDHDTVSGIPKIQKVAEAHPRVTIIPGVEVSTACGDHEIHILGLNVDPENPELNQGLEFYRQGRIRRNRKILRKFGELGIHIPEEELGSRPGEAVGRPHIARWLVRQGIVASIREAFERYLNVGEICYFGREKISQEKCLAMIRGAGGTAVLAHPMRYQFLGREELEKLIRKLMKFGLQGLECYYTSHKPEETRYLEFLARQYDLIRTGGSDYHGTTKPDYRLGLGKGNLGSTMNRIQVERILKSNN